MPAYWQKCFWLVQKSEVKKEWINELNVFPVPDGDTGTNMTLTIMSAVKEVNSLTEVNMYNLSRQSLPVLCAVPEVTLALFFSQLLRGLPRRSATIKS